MKPKDLKYPFIKQERKPLIQDGILFLPARYDEHHTWKPFSFFTNNNPVYIEYCSGNGEWIAHKAKEHPECNWIAVEKEFDRVQKIWSKAKNHQLNNLFIVCGEAYIFSRYYVMPNSIDGFYINFPDPWPKNKHEKNRLIQSSFLEEVAHIGKNQSKLIIVTDHEDYMNQIEQEIVSNPSWFLQEKIPFKEDYGDSYFYRLWKEKGKPICQLGAINKENDCIGHISVDVSLRSNLLWDAQEKLANELILQGKKLSIYLDLSLDVHFPSFVNEMKFHTYSLGIETFIFSFYEKYKDHILSITLFKGPLNFIDLFYQTEMDFDGWKSWAGDIYDTSMTEVKLQDLKKDSFGRQQLRLYSVTILTQYLHRLSAKLPEDVDVVVDVDLLGINKKVFIAQLTSKEMFPHLKIKADDSLQATIGLCLPSQRAFTQQSANLLESVLEEIEETVSIIPESLITESLYGIDYLIIDGDAMSDIGYRQLQGFCATGGTVINVRDNPTGLCLEITWKTFQEEKVVEV